MNFSYLISLALIKIIGSMPIRISAYLLSKLSLFVYYADWKHRNITIENLKLAFGEEKNRKEIESIAKRVFENLSLTFLDFCRISKINKDSIKDLVVFENVDYLWEAISRGKGLIFCTAHFGSWELLAHVFALYHKPFDIVVRPLDNRGLDTIVRKYRTISGNRLIDKRNGLKHIFKALQKKEVVGTLNDQNVKRSEGVFVDFFGKKACTNFALALISLRTEAPVIPVFIIREGLNKHRIKFEKTIEIEKGIDRKQYIIDFIQAFTSVVENYVRKYPEQWFWVHRRWKTRPKALSKKVKDKLEGAGDTGARGAGH